MDERGLTIDPNRDPLEPTHWWEEIGATQKPSPYSTASWVCVQDHLKQLTTVPLPGSDPPVGFETNHIFATVSVYDRKASNPDPEAPQAELDTQGALLGQLSYEIVGPVMTLTDWSHNKWYDSTPISFAFRSLILNTPDCVQRVVVRSPEAFWKSLGFTHPSKDSDILTIENPNTQAVPY